MSFRQAEPHEGRTLRRIVAAANETLAKRWGPACPSRTRTLDTYNRHCLTERVTFALQDGAPIGTFMLKLETPRFAGSTRWRDFFSPHVYLVQMAVLPAMQGRGVGKAMLAHAESEAHALNRPIIRLDAYTGPCGASRFYLRHGFQYRGTGSVNGVALNFFEKELDDK